MDHHPSTAPQNTSTTRSLQELRSQSTRRFQDQDQDDQSPGTTFRGRSPTRTLRTIALATQFETPRILFFVCSGSPAAIQGFWAQDHDRSDIWVPDFPLARESNSSRPDSRVPFPTSGKRGLGYKPRS